MLGLDYIHNTFEFVRDGKTMSVAEAMRTITSTFYTGIIKGTKAKPTQFEYSVNYLKKVRWRERFAISCGLVLASC